MFDHTGRLLIVRDNSRLSRKSLIQVYNHLKKHCYHNRRWNETMFIEYIDAFDTSFASLNELVLRLKDFERNYSQKITSLTSFRNFINSSFLNNENAVVSLKKETKIEDFIAILVLLNNCLDCDDSKTLDIIHRAINSGLSKPQLKILFHSQKKILEGS